MLQYLDLCKTDESEAEINLAKQDILNLTSSIFRLVLVYNFIVLLLKLRIWQSIWISVMEMKLLSPPKKLSFFLLSSRDNDDSVILAISNLLIYITH